MSSEPCAASATVGPFPGGRLLSSTAPAMVVEYSLISEITWLISPIAFTASVVWAWIALIF
jgi:hypothetical protein